MKHVRIILLTLFILFPAIHTLYAQEKQIIGGKLVPVCTYKGDTIPCIHLRQIYIFPPLEFKNNKERQEYYKLVRNVKKTLPLSKMINNAVIETYKYLETLPTKKEKDKHIKRVEKGLKEQYTAEMKKLTYTQGKLLIKLIDRQCNQSSYELVKAFMGPVKAGMYQTFAALFGTSLKKEYDPVGNDKLTERIILLVENGQL